MKKVYWLFSAFLMLSVLVSTPAMAQKQLEPLTISAGSGGMVGSVCVAIRNGYFAEEGLDIQIKSYRNGFVAAQEYLKGATDFGTSNRVGAILSNIDFEKHALVGVLAYSDSQTKIVAKKSAGILDSSDLRGKRIGIVHGTSSHYYLYKYLQHCGIPMSDVEVVFLKKKQLPTAIVSGKIDAFCQHGKPVADALKKLGSDALVLRNSNINRKIVQLIAPRDFIAKNPEKMQGMLRAIKKADAWTVDHKKEAAKIIAEMKNRSYDLVLNFVENEAEFNLSLEQSLLLSFEGVDRWAIENELVPYKEPRNFLDYIDYHPLEQVSPESVSIIR
ncbi:ABC transporter substrate-binding protein [Desulfobaculum bizertense]|uniref:NitT/TauT family transport system substrate-binding protein n=1 Tax=Desulfobaculum bizertense DSM 18034 TaxID=1121442 RepID=A0A1T4W8Q0_9BACT|nr:ABC transporter substrate-binding protein [Desulfobaculum bizertense]UIJ39203.1 ABC transporter substrate-binding protein [Desulfobaculum bizertense]SKA73646.1 NitT/TauT family transport system substrate-binding protein [Desulfobaculum bizertense DSM 18034]